MSGSRFAPEAVLSDASRERCKRHYTHVGDTYEKYTVADKIIRTSGYANHIALGQETRRICIYYFCARNMLMVIIRKPSILIRIQSI